MTRHNMTRFTPRNAAPRTFTARPVKGEAFYCTANGFAGVSATLHPLKLSWRPPTARPSRILGYVVVWRDAAGTMGVHYSRVSKTVLHLAAGRYHMTVRAVYAAVESDAAHLDATVG
jgi:hypothetical protein